MHSRTSHTDGSIFRSHETNYIHSTMVRSHYTLALYARTIRSHYTLALYARIIRSHYTIQWFSNILALVNLHGFNHSRTSPGPFTHSHGETDGRRHMVLIFYHDISSKHWHYTLIFLTISPHIFTLCTQYLFPVSSKGCLLTL